MQDIAVGFLAGGQARRMGGGDKSMIMINGRSILDWQLAATAQHNIRLINANGDASRFSSFGLPVIADTLDDYPGPLAGILACLDYLAENHHDIKWLMSCATDAPFIPVDLANQLILALTHAQADIAQARSSERRHPVFALWPLSIRQELKDALICDGLRKIDDFTDRYNLAIADFVGQPDPFMNVNRPEDIESARSMLMQK